MYCTQSQTALFFLSSFLAASAFFGYMDAFFIRKLLIGFGKSLSSPDKLTGIVFPILRMALAFSQVT